MQRGTGYSRPPSPSPSGGGGGGAFLDIPASTQCTSPSCARGRGPLWRSVRREVVLQLPWRDPLAVLVPLVHLGGMEPFVDVLAERLVHHFVGRERVQRLLQ